MHSNKLLVNFDKYRLIIFIICPYYHQNVFLTSHNILKDIIEQPCNRPKKDVVMTLKVIII
jgi:hypothetical protein